MTNQTGVLQRAETLYELGRYAEVLTMLATVPAEAADDVEVWKLRARALAQVGQSLPARDAANRARALDPDDAHAHLVASWVFRTCGWTDEALPAAQRAVELAPQSANTHRALAQALLDMDPDSRPIRAAGRAIDEALRSAQKAASLAPNDADIRLVLVEIHDQLGNDEARNEAARAALELAPNDAGVHNELARIDLRNQHYTEAASGFAVAAALNPTGPGGSNFALTIHQMFDRRMANAFSKCVFLALGFRLVLVSKSNDSTVLLERVWPAMTALALVALLLVPIGRFGVQIPASRRGAVLKALRRNRLLFTQFGSLALAAPLLFAAAVCPSPVGTAFAFAGVAAWLVAIVLTWVRRLR